MSTITTPVNTAAEVTGLVQELQPQTSAAGAADQAASHAQVSTASPARTTVSVTLEPSVYEFFEKAAIADERPLSKFIARELKKLATMAASLHS